MSSRTSELIIPNVQPGDWVKLNPGAVGVFRVQYSEGYLQVLIPAIQSKRLPVLDRVNILDDLFAFVAAGRTSTVQVLKFIEAYKNEDEYIVWASISCCLDKLNSILCHSQSFRKHTTNGEGDFL